MGTPPVPGSSGADVIGGWSWGTPTRAAFDPRAPPPTQPFAGRDLQRQLPVHEAALVRPPPHYFSSFADAGAGSGPRSRAQVTDCPGPGGRNMPGSILRQCVRVISSVAGQKPVRGTACPNSRFSQDRGVPDPPRSGGTPTRT